MTQLCLFKPVLSFCLGWMDAYINKHQYLGAHSDVCCTFLLVMTGLCMIQVYWKHTYTGKSSVTRPKMQWIEEISNKVWIYFIEGIDFSFIIMLPAFRFCSSRTVWTCMLTCAFTLFPKAKVILKNPSIRIKAEEAFTSAQEGLGLFWYATCLGIWAPLANFLYQTHSIPHSASIFLQVLIFFFYRCRKKQRWAP